MRPRDARTGNQICELERDNIECKTHWFMISAKEVRIVAQKTGESATAKIVIPRRFFNRMVDWYNGAKPSPSGGH
jgi:hypothetical protein